MTLPVPSENVEGEMLANYLRFRDIRFTHIANEGGYGTQQAVRRGAWLKRQGRSKGFPDYAIVLPNIGLLFIELKRQKGGSVSVEQKQWIAALNTCPGVEAHVAKGADEAIKIIESFMPSKSADTSIF